MQLFKFIFYFIQVKQLLVDYCAVKKACSGLTSP